MTFDSGPSDDISDPTVAVLADGDIAFATDVFRPNFTTDMIVARFNADGSRATEFGGGDGWRILENSPIEVALTIAPLPGGGMILGGFASDSFFDHKPGELLLVALRPAGQLWKAFGNGGVVRTNLGFQSDVSDAYAVVHDGKLLVAGQARRDMLVARFDV